jgi:hypothetical protein
MAGMSPEQIAALLGKTRQKGLYTKYMGEFLESGEAGVHVNEQWVDLATKKDTTLKQGFEGVKEKKDAPEGADKVKVIASEGQVFLINLAVAGEQNPELVEAAA